MQVNGWAAAVQGCSEHFADLWPCAMVIHFLRCSCPQPAFPANRRLSGAFAASMRRQSLAPGEAPASPFALTPLIQSDGEEEADVSLLEQNDDEYAAQEQAQL